MCVSERHTGRRMGVRREGAQMAMPMLADWSLGTTIPAKDLDGARRFYEDVLVAQVVMEDPGGIIYRTGDSYFSLYPTEFAGTAQHTLGAFMVQDVEAVVADLRGQGRDVRGLRPARSEDGQRHRRARRDQRGLVQGP